MPTPASITITNQAAIVEITSATPIDKSAGDTPIAEGVVRIVGSTWTTGNPAVNDNIVFVSTGAYYFKQGDETYAYVPKEYYLFIQADLP